MTPPRTTPDARSWYASRSVGPERIGARLLCLSGATGRTYVSEVKAPRMWQMALPLGRAA